MGDKSGKGNKTIEDYTDTVVLNTDIHCKGCGLKFKRRALKCEGVEKVEVDLASNKLTVKGEFDSSKLQDHLEARSHQKFEIVSNQHKSKKTSTVVLKVHLDCKGCIQRAKNIADKVKGVKEVLMDAEKDLMIVEGTMDVDSLVQHIKNNLSRSVEIVSEKGGNR